MMRTISGVMCAKCPKCAAWVVVHLYTSTAILATASLIICPVTDCQTVFHADVDEMQSFELSQATFERKYFYLPSTRAS